MYLSMCVYRYFQLSGPGPFSHKPATHPDTCEITYLRGLPCKSEQDTGLTVGAGLGAYHRRSHRDSQMQLGPPGLAHRDERHRE